MLRHSTYAEVPFLPGVDLASYLDRCRSEYPGLYHRIDLRRYSLVDLLRMHQDMERIRVFEGERKGGRGDAYRRAQRRFPLARRRGIETLVGLLVPQARGSDYIVDVLGGSGTVARALETIRPAGSRPQVITADLAADMVSVALSDGLSAIRQSAQQSLLGTQTVAGALFAYGTHHIPHRDRLAAFREAHRTIVRGGRVVVHDFLEGSASAEWYSSLMDRFTLTGHNDPHFTPDGLAVLLRQAGFRNVDVIRVDDPFVIAGSTPEIARRTLLKHLVDLFSLERLRPGGKHAAAAHSWRETERTVLRYTESSARGAPPLEEIPVCMNGGSYLAELPRVALVGIGERT